MEKTYRIPSNGGKRRGKLSGEEIPLQLQQLDEELLEEQMEMIRQISSEEKIDAILWITSNLVSPTELQTWE